MLEAEILVIPLPSPANDPENEPDAPLVTIKDPVILVGNLRLIEPLPIKLGPLGISIAVR